MIHAQVEPSARRIHVLTGGPYHPVAAQFAAFQHDLGEAVEIHCFDGVEVFEHLDECDLLVLAGLHWTGSSADSHAWPEGVRRCAYEPPDERQKKAYSDYVASGRPLLGWHGGIASYDDWPEFGLSLGFRWDWRVTTHTLYGWWNITTVGGDHPAISGVSGYRIQDELYYNLQVTPDFPFEVLAWAEVAEAIRFPMIVVGEGGRVTGAGRTAYLANGHDLASTANPDFRKVVVNTIGWLLGESYETDTL